MILLDIAYPGRPYRRPIRRIIRDTIQNPAPTKPADTIPAHVPDSVPADTVVSASDTVSTIPNPTDTVKAGQELVGSIGGNGDDASMLLWAIAAVLVALALCYYFARIYRNRLATRNT